MRSAFSIRYANLLFLGSALLVVTLGSLVQSRDLAWGLLFTEVALILAPALLALRRSGVPLREGLNLRPLPARWLPFFFVLGAALWPVGALIDGLMIQLTGMQSVNIPAEALPASTLEQVVYFLALAVAAPLCEEALFRGAIFGAYLKNRSPRFAIVMTALLFAFFHLRLTGLPALLPVAFALTWVVWRTGSLWAGVLVHAGNNTLAALVSLLPSGDTTVLGLTVLVAAGLGLVMVPALLSLVKRSFPLPEQAPEEPEPAAAPAGGLRIYWPLAVFALLFTGVTGLELAQGLNLALMPGRGLGFESDPALTFGEWRYQAANRGGEVVGEAVCRLGAGSEDTARLDCSADVRGYEVTVGNSMWIDSGHHSEWTAEWDRQTLALRAYHYLKRGEDGFTWEAALEDGTLRLWYGNSERGAASLEEETLLENEWAWRAGFMEIAPAQPRLVPFARPMRWDLSDDEKRPGLSQELVQVRAERHFLTPAGEFSADRFQVGKERTAWVEEGTGCVLAWEDGMLTYMLVESSAEGE